MIVSPKSPLLPIPNSEPQPENHLYQETNNLVYSPSFPTVPSPPRRNRHFFASPVTPGTIPKESDEHEFIKKKKCCLLNFTLDFPQHTRSSLGILVKIATIVAGIALIFFKPFVGASLVGMGLIFLGGWHLLSGTGIQIHFRLCNLRHELP